MAKVSTIKIDNKVLNNLLIQNGGKSKVARNLNIQEQSIKAWLRRGRIPVSRLFYLLKENVDEVLKYIEKYGDDSSEDKIKFEEFLHKRDYKEFIQRECDELKNEPTNNKLLKDFTTEQLTNELSRRGFKVTLSL